MQPEQLLESFKKDLENLKDNDKYKINALTIFARDHKDTEKIAHGVVELTTRHVHMIPSGLKLLGLYVIDSIVKNVGAPYRKLYTTSIVDAFVHSFQAIRDEKGRLKLYSLRTTWKDIFPNSRMYELDIRVREHDPAWPLLATPPESKAAFRALPNIPKIQTKHEAKEETNIAEQPPPTSLKATISTSRDPRLNRKRKSSNDAVASPDEFLIDRSGDQKMEAVARKQGKQEEAKVQSKKVPLFGGQDLDMRSQAPVPSTPAARSCVWSSYIDKHAEVGSRREVKDVDMRLAFNPTNDAERVSESVAPTADTPSQPPLNKLPSATSVPVPAIPDRTAPDVQVPASPTPVPLPSFGGLNVPNEVGRVFNATTELPSHRCVPAPLPPIPSHEFHPRISPPLVFDGDARPLLPPQPPMHRPPRGPPIRGPVWSVEINGFPDMVNIGVDPRMLSLVSHPKPPRRITIDGKRYSLLLDRVQPLIMVGDQVHAVRFRCDFATVLIDGRCFNIPGTGFTKVTVGWRPYQAYLGGPGHELVVDGRPHTIPIGSQLTFINLGYHSVGVKFVGNPPRNVNVLPPIPPRLLKWAGQGLFGSPRSLHLAPLNPLVELARLAEGRPPSYGRSSMSQSNQAECGRRFGPSLGAVGTKQPNEKTSPAANSQNANAESSNGNTVASGEPVSQPIDVHELFKKLVKAGIVTAADNSQAVPPPELVSYSWERFKLECPVEVDALYTGHQCGQCGLRFQSDLSPEFASHLDYHYMKNSSEDHDHRSRNFYQAARYWLLSEMTREGAPQFEPGTPVPDLQESKCAAFADPAKNVCAVCYEKFDVFWDHDEEEWMLRDAVLVGDKAYHPICQEDAGKEFPAEEPEQLLESFKKDLENLKDNDKYKINALTIFARDHKDTEKIAHGVVELTTRHVHMIPSGLKLLGLYVIDSIVKNVGAPYRKLYTTSIVDAFVHSFQAIRDEKGRLKLYSLRTTWKDIFPNSRMYELDIRVREHDPAWPLLATPPESKAAFRALPNIPKIQTKHEAKEETNIAEQPPPTSLKATISTSRDPRLNRKRKSSNDAVASPDEFLIDRSGDQKMEAVARKQGKQEEAKVQSKKVPLFGGQDLDMRSQAPVPSTPAARSCVWSSYIDKHAEVGSRREVKDVDMRLAFNPTNDAERVSESVAPTADTPSQPPLNKLPSATSVPVPAIPDRTAPDVQVPASPTPVPLPSFGGLNVPNEVGRVFNATTELPSHRCVPAPLPPIPSHEFHPRISPPLVFEGDARPLLPPQPPMHRPPRGPPIRGPVWSVEINGFPDMVNIGVDPRMLSLVSHPKPPRRITIDGKRYSLLLDRVQPLIMVGDQVHAVRFRCDFATVLIDGRCFNIPGTGFTKVTVGWRPYQAYLGGPGHELVVDGRPHTIPIGSQLTFINVGYHSVGVKFVGNPPRNVNVLPPIPPRLLKWAGQGLFGSPRSLHLAPLNPLVELARLAEGRPPSYGRSSMSQSNQAECGRRFGPSLGAVGTKQPNEKTSPAANSQNANAESSNGNTVASGEPVSQPIDVHELFKKLVKAGIVTAADNSQAVPPPELVSYSWERFKLECPVEVDALYTGHQCGQCGLRFQSDLSPEFASHLDYHYMKNSSEDHDHRSRNFYQAARYWLLSEMTREGAPQFEPGTPVPDLQESKCAAFADPAKNVCAVCYEKFDVFWDHDEEEWMLRDAVLVGDKAYHPICQEDAGKEFPAEEHMDDTKEEEEVKPPVITVKTELAVASPPVSNADNSPEDENAFMCADPSECTQIPGLSPVPVVHSPDQEDPQEETEKPSLQPIKMEPCSNTPVGEQISADPLAALKAVLRGDVSSFIQSHPSS